MYDDSHGWFGNSGYVYSDSASDVKKTGTGGISSGGDKVVKFFCISLSIRRFH